MKRLSVLVTVLAVVLALLPLASLLADAGSWNGWITDENCGAKGAKAEHAACSKRCMDKGAKLVFYNNGDKKIYKLDKQDVAKEHIGHEVTVKGEVKGDAIAVSSIEPAAAPSK
ncbi:MAG TPA: DUF5818 domain-containing protein [Thermoanaerobaculia bacterium]|nr:DUF5818 domain-containing protein [Thermoanaerobaculia bacterium]